MRRYLGRVMASFAFAALMIVSLPASAGTQDFVLVNDTGFDIYEVYISETRDDDWEEDVLGEDILEDGDRLDMTFRGRKACLWDIMAVDEEDDSIEWTAVDLCEVSVVVLMCDKRGRKCWAEFD
ncbi:MAG: argininosuccinate lyase [Deltaproteobacteria bacterium]|nr:argininosuccinate lyase [Deltaproteobacteria bacterium]